MKKLTVTTLVLLVFGTPALAITRDDAIAAREAADSAKIQSDNMHYEHWDKNNEAFDAKTTLLNYAAGHDLTQADWDAVNRITADATTKLDASDTEWWASNALRQSAAASYQSGQMFFMTGDWYSCVNKFQDAEAYWRGSLDHDTAGLPYATAAYDECIDELIYLVAIYG